MEKYLTSEVKTLFKAFEECGYELYLVGGCVRDALLHIEPHDIDFATNATPEQMKEVCAHMLDKMGVDAITYPSGEKFGTLTFALHTNKNTIKSFEVTTYRADGRYEDGRHPKEVHYASTIEEDLARRDFTMNAIAWSPTRGYVDPYYGRDDIRRKMIRTVGNPNERFKEDLLRILRLARFSFRYFFSSFSLPGCLTCFLMSSTISMTLRLAPPCFGPFREDMAAAMTAYVSDPDDVVTLVVKVELFPPPCSMCRTRARSRTVASR